MQCCVHHLDLHRSLAGLSLPAADDALFQRAVSLVNASRPSEAEDLLRSIVNQDPVHVEARILLGFLYLGRSAVAEAQAAFTNVLNRHPDQAAARLGLGISWAQKGMARQATQEFEKILADRSLGDRARIHWIQSLLSSGPKTRRLWREARELTQRHPLIAEHHRILAFSTRRLESIRPGSRAIQEGRAARAQESRILSKPY